MRVSYSTESILRETSPPPKPPLPNRYILFLIAFVKYYYLSIKMNLLYFLCFFFFVFARCTNPPPLPPKRNNQLLQTHAYEGHNIHTELENSNDFPLATIDQ